MASLIDHTSDSSGLSLAIRLQRDATGAWRELVELYAPLVKSWAARSGLDDAAAEDIVQEVFLAVHRSIRQFDPNVDGATFQGWLWRITRNLVLQWFRKPPLVGRGGSTALAMVAALPEQANETSSQLDPPSSAGDTTALLNRAMRQIESKVEPNTWQAFLRTTVHGQCISDVAVDLGMSRAAVRKAKSRTLQRLRKQLGELS